MSLILNYGNAVTGDQRFARPDLEAKLMATLAHSGGIKMFGLRRIGKSTLKLYAIEQLKAANKPVVHFDAQGLHTIEDLLGELFANVGREAGLTQKALGFLAKDSPVKHIVEALARGTPTGERVLAAYWREAYSAIRRGLSATENPPILVIDEFSWLLKNLAEQDPSEGPQAVNQLLAAMRGWRDAGMKMLLTGSIGVAALARQYGLETDHLNDLLPFHVPELTEAETRDFIQMVTEAASQGRWTEAHVDEFLKQSGARYPSFLVKGLLEVGVESPPPPEQFGEIFATQVRPILHDDFYHQFRKRFKVYGEIDKKAQTQLIVPALKLIMEAEHGTTLDGLSLPRSYTRTELSAFLEMLVEDGFVHFTEDVDGNRTWQPASRLAALWWQRAGLA